MSHPESPIRSTQTACRLVVVQDQLQPCPYLDKTVARMPLRLPIGKVTPRVTDEWLALGYRRSGDFLYRAECPECSECKPTRVDVGTFQMTSSMRRVVNRGDRELECYWGMPSVDANRIKLFNMHRQTRHLASDGEQVTNETYRAFLADTCCETRELAIYHGGQLVAIAIVDIGHDSISAVYTHFDPAASRYSLGTYAIMKQFQWAKEYGRRYVYLGMYVADNAHLNYKARFAPQQRLVGDQWIEFS
ncbi:arginyl-tRNA-protein transferase [Rubripirellula tenax]|uniref:Arginyl-tRNA-protein transferase n=1 Tax=Rubripirellula tenax TaxID=2528015 RepID=A0A5C6FC75_9BACT|nr:arginyltransferase [Rubripirellula tenax]TWU59015.1 arginyl-tRNA-protein transferase [Rubripirellula tenax]